MWCGGLSPHHALLVCRSAGGVLAALLLMQFPDNVSWEAADGGANTQVPVIHQGFPVCWPLLALTIVAI